MTRKKKVASARTTTQITEKLAITSDWRSQVLSRMRRLIIEAVPEVVETRKWGGTPVWECGGILCTGETYKVVVKLTFAKGASLKDPKGLFNSSLEGKVRRAIDIREGESVNAVAFKALLREAVAANQSKSTATAIAKASNKAPATTVRAAPINTDTLRYNSALNAGDRAIGDALAQAINRGLPEAENKLWHAHPVWFLDGNPVAGYSKLKGCMRLLFWSGQSFDEPGLRNEGSFKAAEVRFTTVEQINSRDLKRWLKKAREIQWDYKNLVRRRGKLERLK